MRAGVPVGQLTSPPGRSIPADSMQGGFALYRDTDRRFIFKNFLCHEPMVCALVHGAMAATVSGFADRAATLIYRAVRTMAEINHLPTAIIGNFGSSLRFRV
jgi:hypothetical protein